MAWAKFDDRWDDHRKTQTVWHENRGAVALYAMAVVHCARHETDGRVDAIWLKNRLPRKGERDQMVSVLVAAELFDERDGEVWVHDYLDFNPSHAELEAKRERDRSRKAKGGSRSRPSGVQTDSARNPDGFRAASGSPDPTRPDPSRPDPSSTDVDDPTRDAFAVVVERLRRVPEWNAALVQGADQACFALVDSNRDVPWVELAGEAVASKLDPGEGSLRTNSPRQALELRLNDHRAGRRGGDFVPGKKGGRSAVDHYAAMRKGN